MHAQARAIGWVLSCQLYQVLIGEGLKLGMMESLTSFEHRIEALVRGLLVSYGGALRPRRVELATFLLTRAIRGVVWAIAIERPELFEDPELADELGALMLGYLLP